MAAEREDHSPKLDAIPDVDIDESGIFKYILLKITDGDKEKNIVRGYEWADFHADIYERVQPGIEELGLGTECVGGGRIRHNAAKKKILVYGFSMGFGRADHKISVAKLKAVYPNYTEITFSNDGY
ncbi:predicted protein [Nematostella vectensis]|uniref:14 kDa phosphohistidine phosphatase n=1 Tax=Nematostella vectensis TaxID=45351 RepID=A7SNS5_NEMVE|nr:14 kDa phosphohistidine phosphatase [Nematostella vectensis]EDO34648.1 predicted protein [Nematostella vectensis]|eukprot:XP_001626748.1 predicted protein [Nematostella vectensis]